MTITPIANLEAGLSVRTKLNSLIGLANTDLINPIELGAGGDGTADDTTELNLAIADANSTGRGIVLPAGKTFKVTSDLTTFTNGMTIVGGGTIKAQNGIACLRHFPTGFATSPTQMTVTSLSLSPWQGLSGHNTTVVNMASTTGLVVGQWVKVGSTTITVPGSDLNFYWEWAQIRAITTNTNISLDRVLEGHARGIMPGVHSNYRLFALPATLRPVTVDVRFEADESVASINSTTLTNRQAFFMDRGSVGAVVRIRGRRWWTTVAHTTGILSQLDVAWEELPDISDSGIAAANQAFGYGVHCGAGSFGVAATIRGGTCRHGITLAAPALASYDATRPFDLGLSFYCGSTPASRVSGASAAAYDTHATSFGATLYGEVSAGVELVDGGANALGVQNRGFNSTLGVRIASNTYVGYQLLEGDTDWGALGWNVTVLDAIEVRDVNGGSHVRIGGISSVNTVVLEFRSPIFTGPSATATTLNSVDIQSGFAGRVVLDSPVWRDTSGRCVFDQSGLGTIRIHGGHLSYRPATTPDAPFRIASTAANRGDGTTGSWTVDNFLIGQVTTALPPGAFQIDSALNANIAIGRLLFVSGSLPLRSAASTGGQIVLTSLFDLGEIRPFLIATGNMALTAVSGKKYRVTGNTTGWPIFDGFEAALVNRSGANRTIAPASGTCIVAETGATAASVTLANNKGISIAGDGADLWVFGDVL